MPSDQLQEIIKKPALSIYEITASKEETGKVKQSNNHCRRFIASTPETRAICNDPVVSGYEYTSRLCKACTKVLGNMDFGLKEREVVVLNILRGGLNFGLRDVLAEAYHWYRRNSSFISAQRHATTRTKSLGTLRKKATRKSFSRL